MKWSRAMKINLIVPLLFLVFPIQSQAASVYAGKAKAAAVCSQCHGIESPAAESSFPILAGRSDEYLEQALRDYRNKTRLSDIMNNIAGSLSDKDINNISAYYSRLK